MVPGLAYNTVQTILIRLYDKGLLLHEPEGRTHLYRPAQAQADLAAQQMHDVLARGSDHTAVLQRFLTTLSQPDAAALRGLVAGGRTRTPDPSWARRQIGPGTARCLRRRTKEGACEGQRVSAAVVVVAVGGEHTSAQPAHPPAWPLVF